jgi:CheY-like chemotaxis protein
MSEAAPVLVVDDDEDIRAFLALALRDEGYVVELAANGAEALEKVRRRTPRAIILDMAMPVMDGRTFLAACRTEPWCSDVPVIAMSAAERVEAGDGTGIRAFLAKPFDLNAMVGMVAGLA